MVAPQDAPLAPISISRPVIWDKASTPNVENGTLRSEVFVLKKHYFSINSHYGMSDKQSLEASKKAPKDSGSTSKKMYHTVRKGENLSKIAKKYGTSVNKICQLNGIRKNKALKVGQKLRVK